MSRFEREKGKRGEREVAALLREIFPTAKRGWQSRNGSDAPDVDGTPFWIEVKRHKRAKMRPAIRQAIQDVAIAGDKRPPVAFTRSDGEDWFVAMRGEDWLDLVEEWKERRE